ncbi:phosphonate ABC transporter ATP-binding protein [Vitreoscilla massiliensis]|uniref:Phosphonate ABC transporter ATP-binding protein n=1 Tax=Vitreoscilla massiliensis TaxID=1689272 RepID=A0ABY4DZJ5_9NEIS|nr:phosphonate ABC transporter ATP-binding protein [Vitreoscilla massiliensis]UOO88959.1 phosphonate ABC transporter ATP-binding protein [Vitreoscilla massiliensis]
MQAIHIRGLNKFYGRKQVLFDIALDFPQAQMVALIGPSGSGKSTLLRHINGLNVAASGEIHINGEPLFQQGRLNRQVRAQRSKIGYIFQQFNLVNRLSVLDNVLIGALGRIPKWRAYLRHFTQEEKQQAFDCLARVGLSEFVHQRASQLSGGQQQRVAIAKILMQQADIILADEPIASLDPESAKSVMNTLQSIHQQDGKTVIVTLHQVDYARRYCPRTVALKQGVVQFDGATSTLSDGFLNQLYGSELRPEDTVVTSVTPVLNPTLAAVTQ